MAVCSVSACRRVAHLGKCRPMGDDYTFSF